MRMSMDFAFSFRWLSFVLREKPVGLVSVIHSMTIPHLFPSWSCRNKYSIICSSNPNAPIEQQEGKNDHGEDFIPSATQSNSRWWPTQFLSQYSGVVPLTCELGHQKTRAICPLKQYDMNFMINMQTFVISDQKEPTQWLWMDTSVEIAVHQQ